MAVLATPLGCGDGSSDDATLTRVETEVFSVSCVFSACHSGPAPKAGLDLNAPVFAKIVDVAAMEKTGAKLVVPGDPNASFLLDKLLDRDLPSAPAGETPWTAMPPGGVSLEEDRIDLVRRWIEAGALDD